MFDAAKDDALSRFEDSRQSVIDDFFEEQYGIGRETCFVLSLLEETVAQARDSGRTAK